MDRRAMRTANTRSTHSFLNIHGIFSNPVTAALAITLIIGYVVDRQLKPRPLDNRELLLAPLALLYFGADTLSKTQLTPFLTTDIFCSVIIGAYFGFRSLSSMKLYADKLHGEAIVEGTWAYLKWYLLSIICRALVTGFLYIVFSASISIKAIEAGFLLSAGVFVGMRSVELYFRSQRLGIPLAKKRK